VHLSVIKVKAAAFGRYVTGPVDASGRARAAPAGSPRGV
jgi:hypothetical protein